VGVKGGRGGGKFALQRKKQKLEGKGTNKVKTKMHMTGHESTDKSSEMAKILGRKKSEKTNGGRQKEAIALRMPRYLNSLRIDGTKENGVFRLR